MLSHIPEDTSPGQNFFSVFICVVCLNFAVTEDFFRKKFNHFLQEPIFWKKKSGFQTLYTGVSPYK